MDAIEAVCAALAGHAEAVRRRYWRDPEFRTVCEDYRDAALVIASLETDVAADRVRAEEYRQVAAELLAEAAEMLRGDRACANPIRKFDR